MPRCRKPLRVRTYDPDPYIVLFGCRPWPPPGDGKTCPVCHGRTASEKRLVVCGWCSAGSPPLARFIRARQLARNAEAADAEALEKRAREALEKRHPVVLCERDRRLLWNGYRGSFDSESQKLTNLSKSGRDFLTAKRQVPDWSLILDRKGNVVGRLEVEDLQDAQDHPGRTDRDPQVAQPGGDAEGGDAR